jgi:predicted nucleic acid binding AN1-type Zn finger protein
MSEPSKKTMDSYMEVFGKKTGCPHKNKFLNCRECTGSFCYKCIQLEAHFCPKLDERSKIEKENLAKKLVKVVAPKIEGF